MKEEIWKPIPGFEGQYEISNFGRIKSLARIVLRSDGKKLPIKERMLKTAKTKKGYLMTAVSHGSKMKTIVIHTLVWDVFGDKPRDGMKLLIDHIDNDKTNNRIDNLQLLTNRQNIGKGALHYHNKTLPTGVHIFKRDGNYRAQIQYNKKRYHLGYYDNPDDASKAYQMKLKEINLLGIL